MNHQYLIGKTVSSDKIGGWYGDGEAPIYNIIKTIDEEAGEFSIDSVFNDGSVLQESGIPIEALALIGESITCTICGYTDNDEAGFIDGICLGCARVNDIDY